MRLKTTTSLGLLLAVTATVPLLALCQGQDDEDWARHVDKACNSPRYGLRLAAARKLADGGAAAVPAIRAFARQHGMNALPSAVVDAIADSGKLDPAVVQLLHDQAADGDFYWRSSAMRGLALRAPLAKAAGADTGKYRELFERYRDDAAWLTRTHARLGLCLLGAGDARAFVRDEPDSRAKVRLTRLLLEHDATVPDLQPLLDALGETRTFLGDPWGARLANEAHQALKNWLGDAHPLPDGQAFDDRESAIRMLRDAAAKKSGQTLTMPALRADGDDPPTDGLELLSCKSGDQFVAWHADGTVTFDLELRDRVQLPAASWQNLAERLAALPLDQSLGVVICDAARIRTTEPAHHAKFAPASLPAAVTDWLQDLAGAIEGAGAGARAAALRKGIEQFAGR